MRLTEGFFHTLHKFGSKESRLLLASFLLKKSSTHVEMADIQKLTAALHMRDKFVGSGDTSPRSK